MSSPLISIKRNDDKIEIVDQLLLPHVTKFIPIDSIQDAHEAIKSMKIRGAPAIASLASLSLAQYLIRAQRQAEVPHFLSSGQAIKEHVQPLLDYLFTSRPTAVNLGNAIKRLSALIDDAIAAQKDPKAIVDALIADSQLIADEDVGRNKAMAKWGGDWLIERVKPSAPKTLNLLTVCNTGSLATSGYGTALGLITYLHEVGQLNKAHFTQTTPYHQGSRLTALELKTLQIPSVMICDTMVGSLFQHHDIHAVVVGADRIARNGDTANKIGTYNAAVIAARHNIPFIVVAPITTVDLDIESGAQIPIEQRPALEACLVRGAIYPPPASGEVEQAQVMITPTGLEGIYNPSFDVTPAELITAIVTEKGVAVKKDGASVFDLSPIV